MLWSSKEVDIPVIIISVEDEDEVRLKSRQLQVGRVETRGKRARRWMGSIRTLVKRNLWDTHHGFMGPRVGSRVGWTKAEDDSDNNNGICEA